MASFCKKVVQGSFLVLCRRERREFRQLFNSYLPLIFSLPFFLLQTQPCSGTPCTAFHTRLACPSARALCFLFHLHTVDSAAAAQHGQPSRPAGQNLPIQARTSRCVWESGSTQNGGTMRDVSVAMHRGERRLRSKCLLARERRACWSGRGE